jgi:hypothetical protein
VAAIFWRSGRAPIRVSGTGRENSEAGVLKAGRT